jgi:manganese/iron transport system ATP-binding protein
VNRASHSAHAAAATWVSPAGIVGVAATVTYRNGHHGLRDASFEIDRHDHRAGRRQRLGKSTLFKAIMGFVRRHAATISILGMPVGTALRRNLVAYVPQSEEVDWNFPVLVEDVVMMGRYGHMGMMRMPEAADRAGRRCGAGAGRHERVPQAPDRRTVGRAEEAGVPRPRAGAGGRVILLDEPFTGVDVKTEDGDHRLLLRAARRGPVMLVSTHNLGSVPEFCDRTVLINRTVLAYGPTAETSSPRPISNAPSAACCATSLGGAGCMTTTTRAGDGAHRRRAPAGVLWRQHGCEKPRARETAHELLLEPFGYGYMLNAMWVSARWSAASAPSSRPT